MESFAVLEPTVDGFRNYFRPGEPMPLEHGLLERAYMLTLTAPEMTVLIGGMRALDANFGQSPHGVFTDRPETLTQRLLREPARHGHRVEAVGLGRERLRGPRSRDRRGQVDRHRRRPRLRLALRAAGACRRSTRATTPSEKFVRDFVAAWDKVMNLDRFDRS